MNQSVIQFTLFLYSVNIYTVTISFFVFRKGSIGQVVSLIKKVSFRVQCSVRIHFTQDHLCFVHPNCFVFNNAVQTQQQAYTMQHGLLRPPLGIHLSDCMGECLINLCMNPLISTSQDHRADCITTEMDPSPKAAKH